MNYRKFMILSSPRSGTHMLRTALNNHPGIVCQSEMFNPDFIISETYELSASDDEILERYIFKPYSENVEAVGFIIHRSQARFGNWPELWSKLEADRDIKIILLHRSNLLKRYLSHQVMRAKLNDRDLVQTFEVDELEQEFEERTRELAEFTERFSTHAMIKIRYEDLCEKYEQTIAKVQYFLGLERLNIQPTTQTNPRPPLSDAIVNFDQLRREFHGTKWGDLFRDDTIEDDFIISASAHKVGGISNAQASKEGYPAIDVNSPTNQITIAKNSDQWQGSVLIQGRHNIVEIHNDLSVKKNLRIEIAGSHNRIEIGNDVWFDEETLLSINGDNNTVRIGAASNGCLIVNIVSNETIIDVGESVTMTGLKIESFESSSVLIGRDCLFADAVRISSSDQCAVYDRSNSSRLNVPEKVEIANHVFIGSESLILSGAKVGSGAVLNSQSVVNRDSHIPSNCRASGAPATLVEKNIAWTREFYSTLPIEFNRDWDK